MSHRKVTRDSSRDRDRDRNSSSRNDRDRRDSRDDRDNDRSSKSSHRKSHERLDYDYKEQMEITTNLEVEVFPTFESMGLKEDLLRGIYSYGKI